MHERLVRQTMDRFVAHREAWQNNPATRTLYGQWYGEIRRRLPDRSLGPWIELGSGPGFARSFIADLELSDVVKAPWHDHEISAEALPFEDRTVGALVLVDVLHHLVGPASFFSEAARVLRPGGRVVMLEPYVSPISFAVYRYLHEEDCDLRVNVLADGGIHRSGDGERGDEDGDAGDGDRDPFRGNQAIPSVLFGRQRAAFEQRWPEFEIVERRRLAGLCYPASGGFSRRPLLPMPLWRWALSFENRLPEWAFALAGFRLLVTLNRRES